MPLHINVFDEHPANNIALSEISNEIACLFYLIGEDDKTSEKFVEYLKTKISNNIQKYVPFNKEKQAYAFDICAQYGTKTFVYSPKGLFKLGHLTIDAPKYEVPTLHIVESEKDNKPKKVSRTELNKESEFPLLCFNWGLHTQTALNAGHTMTLFTKDTYDIKLAQFLKADAEDRLIAKSIDYKEIVKQRIMDNLKYTLETYLKITDTEHLSSRIEYTLDRNYNYGGYNTWDKKWKKIEAGSKYLNDNDTGSLMKITNYNVENMLETMYMLFGGLTPDDIWGSRIYHNKNKVIDFMNYNRNYALTQHEFYAEPIIFNKASFTKLRKQKDQGQILFVKNADKEEQFIAALKNANSKFEMNELHYCNDMGNRNNNRASLNEGMLISDIETDIKNTLTTKDVHHDTFEHLDRTEFLNTRIEFLTKMAKQAIDELPDEIYVEFNKLMKTSTVAPNMKLKKIYVTNPKNDHYADDDYPNIIFEFDNVPIREYDRSNECRYTVREISDSYIMCFDVYGYCNPNEPSRQMAVDHLIDIYRQLDSIDNEFIRKTLLRMKLIDDKFKPVKYSEDI